MKKLSTTLGLGSVIWLFSLTPSWAGPAFILSFPQIAFDSTVGPGENLYTTQGLHYDVSQGMIAISARALSITFDGVTSTPLINGTIDLRAKFVSSTTSDGKVNGFFTTFDDTLQTPDVVIRDETGTLLSINYVPGGLLNTRPTMGTNIGDIYCTFVVTGGSLASFFNGVGAQDSDLFDLSPIVSANSFSANFDGSIRGEFGPIATVSEPTALALFVTNLLFGFNVSLYLRTKTMRKNGVKLVNV